MGGGHSGESVGGQESGSVHVWPDSLGLLSVSGELRGEWDHSLLSQGQHDQDTLWRGSDLQQLCSSFCYLKETPHGPVLSPWGSARPSTSTTTMTSSPHELLTSTYSRRAATNSRTSISTSLRQTKDITCQHLSTLPLHTTIWRLILNMRKRNQSLGWDTCSAAVITVLLNILTML